MCKYIMSCLAALFWLALIWVICRYSIKNNILGKFQFAFRQTYQYRKDIWSDKKYFLRYYLKKMLKCSEQKITNHILFYLGGCSWLTFFSLYLFEMFFEYKDIVQFMLLIMPVIYVLFIWEKMSLLVDRKFFFIISCLICIIGGMCIKSYFSVYSIDMLLWSTILTFIMVIALYKTVSKKEDTIDKNFYFLIFGLILWFIFFVRTPSDLSVEGIGRFFLDTFFHK